MAELALAIVPIFFGAVRGFSIIREKAHLLRHYHKEIKCLRDKVDAQCRNLKGEVHHLIIDTLEVHLADSIIRDDDHKYWKNAALEAALKRHLGIEYPNFIQGIEEINAELAEITNKLSVFAPPDVRSDRFRETRDRFRLVFRKEEYNDSISRIKESIAELKRIRKLVHKIQKVRPRAAPRERQEDRDAAGIDETVVDALKQSVAIRHLSSALQSLVRHQWNCSNPSHSHHDGRLMIGMGWQQKHVLWLLETSGRQGHAVLSNRFLFSFQVASQLLRLPTPESLDLRSSDEIDPPRSPKRLRTSIHGSAVVNGDLCSNGTSPRGIQRLCQQLEGCAMSPRTTTVCDVENENKMRERFEFEGKDLGNWSCYKLSSATELFSQPVKTVLNRERVQFALALLKGALANYSTPAWPQGCVLEATGFLRKPDGAAIDLSDALRTLNIQTQVGGSDSVDIAMEEGSVAFDEDLRDTYGIQNQILYRLGVALLSIALWTKIDWRNIAAVRRKAAALTELGHVYRDAVNRLIWGNFGIYPPDLDSEDLRSEIIRTVIGPLERRAEPHRLFRCFAGDQEPEISDPGPSRSDGFLKHSIQFSFPKSAGMAYRETHARV
ncbi:hypothetical protein C7999DRAFT_35411 [Corynascus novoguineensis]|uniref:Uncharacterized protein n=1 Tax=Corynascus novoguineensis TaxID=1126955 RepID=A0AAN7CLC8_9PEZI|nr:hypothetical protein C7999DRAFT_35411 [Corynascus novoguineensis]